MVASNKYTAPKEDGTFTLTIPTKKDESADPAQDRKIDLSQMDERDLKSLHESGEWPSVAVCRASMLCSTHFEPTCLTYSSSCKLITTHCSAADPFMYYSIPGVLKASLNLEDVDYSDITSRSRSHADSNPSSSPSQSHPRQEREAVSVEDDANKVSRRTRVSFECHPSVLMEDIMMNDLDQEFGDELPDLDEILSLFCERAGSTRQ